MKWSKRFSKEDIERNLKIAYENTVGKNSIKTDLPVDKNDKEIRIGDVVIIIGKSGRPELGIVYKITPEFLFTECPLFGDLNKRRFKNVEIKEKGFWNES